MKKTYIALALAAALVGCKTLDEQPTQRVGLATLRLADGRPAGTALFLANGPEVNVSITVAGVSPGIHGVHLHATGSCDAAGFASAGGHLNPAGRQHGAENPAGAHFGDLPNVTAGEGGRGSVSATLPGAPVQVVANLFDADGTAVVVHAGADDYRTDPSGNSGNRIACGVVTRP